MLLWMELVARSGMRKEVMVSRIELIHGDCLVEMETIPDKSRDIIFSDIPYGTTNCKWDSVLDLDIMWKHLNRIIKDNGVILLFAQSPYDKVLACSNLKMYRYEWIWEKTQATGHLNSKHMPMKAHENILVFYKKKPIFNPQMTEGHSPVHSYTKHQDDGKIYGKTQVGISGGGSTKRFPRDVIKFKSDKQKLSLHETQKPVPLLEYIFKSYMHKGCNVLDFCAGSGSTGEACLNLGLDCLMIEKDSKNFSIMKERIENLNYV